MEATSPLPPMLKLNPDQATTILGILAALNLYLTARGTIDQPTCELISAVLVLLGGYFTNKRA